MGRPDMPQACAGAGYNGVQAPNTTNPALTPEPVSTMRPVVWLMDADQPSASPDGADGLRRQCRVRGVRGVYIDVTGPAGRGIGAELMSAVTDSLEKCAMLRAGTCRSDPVS